MSNHAELDLIELEAVEGSASYQLVGSVLIVAVELIKKAFKPGEWNEMTVEAVGKDITVYLNGIKTAALKNDKGRLKGYFGLQLHGTVEMYVEFKDIKIKDLSITQK